MALDLTLSGVIGHPSAHGYMPPLVFANGVPKRLDCDVLTDVDADYVAAQHLRMDRSHMHRQITAVSRLDFTFAWGIMS